MNMMDLTCIAWSERVGYIKVNRTYPKEITKKHFDTLNAYLV